MVQTGSLNKAVCISSLKGYAQTIKQLCLRSMLLLMYGALQN